MSEPTEELKPCPFCGMTGPLERVAVGDTEIIECDRCQVSGPHVRSALPHEVTKHWNTRADDWQPIENAPKDGSFVWGVNHGGTQNKIYYCTVRNTWRRPVAGGWFVPTHYMPLPQPPKEEG